MTRRRYLRIATSVITLIIIILLPTACDKNLSYIETRYELPKGQIILATAGSELKSVQKGDAFVFCIEVLYDTSQVSNIDTESLDYNVKLSPFDIRNITETEFKIDAKTSFYKRDYEIQFITGDVEKYYEFPTIIVRYKLKDIDGYAETSVVPDAVYLAPRLPDSATAYIINNIQQGHNPLNPLSDKIENSSNNYLSWVLWAIGGLLAVATVVAIIDWIAIDKNRRQVIEKTGLEETIAESYNNLLKNIEVGVKPIALFHQIDNIVRLVLIEKENLGWLEDIKVDIINSHIESSVNSLLEKVQQVYITEDINPQEFNGVIKQVHEILQFYFGVEVESWQK